MRIEEKFEAGTLLPIIEKFYTVQGEGYHTGKAAYFIRIGGCDIGCYWCDTKISWRADLHKAIPVEAIVAQAAQMPGKAVVVTGGEPSAYDLTPLTEQLKDRGIQTFVETSGAYELRGKWDWVCLSPKQQKPPTEIMYVRAHELKMIIFEQTDFDWAEACAKKVGADCKLYLQPEWSRSKELIPVIVEYVKENPKWRISLQSHKYMHVP